MRYARIIGHVENVTDDAILMKAGRMDKLWLPRVVVKNGDLAQKGDVQIEVLEDWLAEKRETWWKA